MVDSWLGAFVVTVLVEAPIVWAATASLLRGWGLVVGVSLQAVTHPVLWFLFPRFEPYALWVLVAEAGVVTAETALLSAVLIRAGQSPRPAVLRALLVSFVANLASVAVGLWIRG